MTHTDADETAPICLDVFDLILRQCDRSTLASCARVSKSFWHTIQPRLAPLKGPDDISIYDQPALLARYVASSMNRLPLSDTRERALLEHYLGEIKKSTSSPDAIGIWKIIFHSASSFVYPIKAVKSLFENHHILADDLIEPVQQLKAIAYLQDFQSLLDSLLNSPSIPVPKKLVAWNSFCQSIANADEFQKQLTKIFLNNDFAYSDLKIVLDKFIYHVSGTLYHVKIPKWLNKLMHRKGISVEKKLLIWEYYCKNIGGDAATDIMLKHLVSFASTKLFTTRDFNSMLNISYLNLQGLSKILCSFIINNSVSIKYKKNSLAKNFPIKVSFSSKAGYPEPLHPHRPKIISLALLPKNRPTH